MKKLYIAWDTSEFIEHDSDPSNIFRGVFLAKDKSSVIKTLRDMHAPHMKLVEAMHLFKVEELKPTEL